MRVKGNELLRSERKVKRNQSVAEYCSVVQCSRYGKSGEFVLSRVRGVERNRRERNPRIFFCEVLYNEKDSNLRHCNAEQ